MTYMGLSELYVICKNSYSRNLAGIIFVFPQGVEKYVIVVRLHDSPLQNAGIVLVLQSKPNTNQSPTFVSLIKQIFTPKLNRGRRQKTDDIFDNSILKWKVT